MNKQHFKPPAQHFKHIQINNNNYEILEKIGNGSYGIVFRANFEKNEYAIKKLQMRNDYLNLPTIISELCFVIKITARLNEILPIIKIYDYEYKEMDNSLYYVMEVGKCSLDEYFQSNLEGKDDLDRMHMIWIIYSYILKALLFLESIKIVHRDIKPQNFVVFDDNSEPWGINIKLIDFGTIRNLDQNIMTKTNNIYGSPAYMAPETFKKNVSFNSDIWSLGIILFNMIFNGDFPSYVRDEKSVERFASISDQVEFPSCSGIYDAHLEITKKCLEKDVKKRYSASKLYEYTKKKYNFKNLNRIIPDSYINKTASDELLTELEKAKGKNDEEYKESMEEVANYASTKNTCIQTLHGHSNWVYCLQLIDKNTLASSSEDGDIKIWDLNNYKCIRTLQGHSSWVWCLQLIDKNTLASGSADHTIKIWDLDNYRCIQTLQVHSVRCLHLIDNYTFASGSDDGAIRIWDFNNKKCIQTLQGHSDWVRCLQLINKSTLASCGHEITIKIWDLNSYKCIRTLQGHSSWVYCLQLIDKNTLASGSADHTIKIWDLDNYRCIQTLQGHSNMVKCLQLIDNYTLASGGDDYSIKIWDLNNNECIQTLKGHSKSVRCLVLIEKYNLASGADDNTIKIWDFNN